MVRLSKYLFIVRYLVRSRFFLTGVLEVGGGLGGTELINYTVESVSFQYMDASTFRVLQIMPP